VGSGRLADNGGWRQPRGDRERSGPACARSRKERRFNRSGSAARRPWLRLLPPTRRARMAGQSRKPHSRNPPPLPDRLADALSPAARHIKGLVGTERRTRQYLGRIGTTEVSVSRFRQTATAPHFDASRVNRRSRCDIRGIVRRATCRDGRPSLFTWQARLSKRSIRLGGSLCAMLLPRRRPAWSDRAIPAMGHRRGE